MKSLVTSSGKKDVLPSKKARLGKIRSNLTTELPQERQKDQKSIDPYLGPRKQLKTNEMSDLATIGAQENPLKSKTLYKWLTALDKEM